MKFTRLVTLIAVVLGVLISTSAESKEPGEANQCPSLEIMPPFICAYMEYPPNCTDHSECSGGLCCPNECGLPICMNYTADVCTQPVVSGPCAGAFGRWYYDSRTGYCNVFVYGGCYGNGNRFDTEEECRNVCNATPAKKPGQCPPSPPSSPEGATICQEDCKSDYDCPEMDKCCKMGCHTKCEKAQFFKECPAAAYSICSDNQSDYKCFTDTDCPGGQNCCSADGFWCGTKCK